MIHSHRPQAQPHPSNCGRAFAQLLPPAAQTGLLASGYRPGVAWRATSTPLLQHTCHVAPCFMAPVSRCVSGLSPARGLHILQGLHNVRPRVLNVLHTGGEADEVLLDANGRTLLWAKAPVALQEHTHTHKHTHGSVRTSSASSHALPQLARGTNTAWSTSRGGCAGMVVRHCGCLL